MWFILSLLCTGVRGCGFMISNFFYLYCYKSILYPVHNKYIEIHVYVYIIYHHTKTSRVALRDKYISAVWNYVWTCSLCSFDKMAI